MRLLLVDNHDSFTFNLAQLLGRLGAPPRVVRNDAATVEELLALGPDAVVLSPGPGSPERARDVGVCRALVERLDGVPLLGVCLGHQVIGVALGARVVRAPEPFHGRRSPVRHGGTGLFAGLPERFEVVRYHSLVLDPDTLPCALDVTARTDDGLVMGVAHRSRPLHGVQFHPESILTEHGERLIENFLGMAAAASAARLTSPAPVPPQVSPSGGGAPRARPRRRERARMLPWIDPERAFLALFAASSRAFWLDGTGRFTCMGAAGDEELRVTGSRLERRRGDRVERSEGDPFTWLADRIDEGALPAGDGDGAAPPFRSGYVGWLGYELKQFTEGGPGPRAAGALPDALLVRADRVLVFDRERREVTLFCRLEPEEADAVAERWFDATSACLLQAPPVPEPVPGRVSDEPFRFRPDRGRARYLDDVRRIQALLRDGEAYEVCLTTQLRAAVPPGRIDPLTLHRVLRRLNPAPHAAFFRTGDVAVVSASPERFVRIDPDGTIESRPIKGTRPRGRDAAEDRRLAAELAASVKDRAEHLMIVDLVRNDLGRVAQVGSVEVPSLMEVEAHPSVFQMVSTVRATIASGVRPLEAVRALFPGGSMTGAPKIAAMRIIAEREGAPRGVYSGGLGALSFDGGVDLGMVIRTVVVRPGEISIGVGGAVVTLSDPEEEYREALTKAAAPLRAVALAAGLDPEAVGVEDG